MMYYLVSFKELLAVFSKVVFFAISFDNGLSKSDSLSGSISECAC